MKRFLSRFLVLLIAAALLLSACNNNRSEPEGGAPTATERKASETWQPGAAVSVDFSIRQGVPLFKKYGLFNSGIAPMEEYRRDIYTLDNIYVESLRVDLFFGNPAYTFGETLTGTADNITYNFETLDEWMQLLDSHEIIPYMSWCYIPIPLQIDNDWRSGPVDLDAWQRVHKQYAQHCREIGIQVYHEIYNEPDLGDVFFTGSWEDYLNLYRYGVKGLLEGDPEAVIGGPSTAIIEKQRGIDDFLDMVIEEELPLDFFSFHSYPQDGTHTERGYVMRTKEANMALAVYGDAFATTELHMNEINTIPWPWPVGGPLDSSLTASLMMQSFKDLLDETDLVLAHWAQWLSSTVDGLGMVESDGKIKSTMHAYRMYGQMPLARVKAGVDGEGLDIMASNNEDTACVMLWNTEETAHDLELSLQNIPFESGTIEVYKLDDQTYPYPRVSEFELTPALSMQITDLADQRLAAEVGGFGIVFVKIMKAESSELPELPEAEVVRKHHYYPQRNIGNYAEFNKPDWSIWLGMGDNDEARSLVGVELAGCADSYTCSLEASDGMSFGGEDAYLGVRVDYRVGGQYVKSVEFLCGGSQRQAVIPWGTGNSADEVVPVESVTSQWQLELAKYAPEGWTGEAILSFDAQNIGTGAEAVFSLHK